MKLTNLKIRHLYGNYDYNVEFNEDVTFIYGENGCGKTTILNIIEAIITGQLYKLFGYKFAEILLGYKQSLDNKKHFINIKFRGEQLEITFENKPFLIEKEARYMFDDASEQRDYYFRNYEILSKINKTFNYVYLPLNRNSDHWRSVEPPYTARPIMRRNTNVIYEDNYDISMQKVENLIKEKYREIYSDISIVNDTFRNEVLKSLIEIENNTSFQEIIENIAKKQQMIEDMSKTKSAYIKILKDLNLIDRSEEKKYNDVFEQLIVALEKGSEGLVLDVVFKVQEIFKIKKLLPIAAEMEQKKTEIRKPIELFIGTINEFINNKEDDKTIQINNVGDVSFITRYTQEPIDIQLLSSGEKQLITFFANLIFNVENKTNGIFVVDEPELSLHLTWQQKFVEKALKVNNNIQLIFATHSPEFVGKYRDRMYKLKKKYVGNIGGIKTSE